MRPVKKQYKDSITTRQLALLAFTGLFSPLIWLLPHTASQIAGAAAIFSPFFALLPLLLLGGIARGLFKGRRDGEGLADIIIRCLGKPLGKFICLLYLFWIIFYAAVSLRSSSERFLSTIFPGGALWIFMSVTLLLAFIGAFGRVRSLAGSSQIFFRMILMVLAAVFLFTLPRISSFNLLPYTYKNIPLSALGGLAVANAVSPAFYILFLAEKVKDPNPSKKAPFILSGIMLLISFLMMLAIIGNFGAEFTNTMQNPFFTMIRNISFFNVVERVEAVIVAMWVLSDFVFLSSLLIISKTLSGVVFPIKRKTIPLVISAVAVFILGMEIESSAFSFAKVAGVICPIINAVMSFLLPTLIFFAGKLRKKL